MDTENYIWKNYLKEILIKKNKGLCEICKKSSSKMHLHHLDYDNVNSNTVMYLCVSCHKFIHSSGLKNYKQIINLLSEKKDSEISKQLNIPRLRVLRIRKHFKM